MTAYFLDGSPAGTRVARVERRALHRSIVESLAAGIQTGIPAEVLDGHQAHRAAADLVVTDQRTTRLRDLRAKASEARRKADRAMSMAEDAHTADEEGLARDRARRHLDLEKRLREDIARLEAEEAARGLGDGFDGEVDYLLKALSGLLSDDGLVTADQASALAAVLDSLRLEVHGTTVHWQTRVLLPADGHVVSLGPFHGAVPMVGNPVPPAALNHLAPGKQSISHRRNAIEDLQEAGYPKPLATAAALAPGPWVVSALLNRPTTWPGVPDGFDHDQFNAHVRDAWRAQRAWPANAYVVLNPTRQRLVDFLAQNGGSVTLEFMMTSLPALGLRRSHLDSMLVGRKTSSGNVIPPVLQKGGKWLSHRKHWPTALVQSIRCPLCSEPVTAVVIVPEVPDGLLCRTCLVMPSNPQRRFPSLYADLALTGLG